MKKIITTLLVSICLMIQYCLSGVENGSKKDKNIIREYVFIIDTSKSMNNNQLLSKLRVAVDDHADTIPIDGSSRIWIFTFDEGLHSRSFSRLISKTTDLQESKIFLNSLKAQGNQTWIFQALGAVEEKIKSSLSDNEKHDFVIHLFTDGNDNGPKKYTFAGNLNKYKKLRDLNSKRLSLYYHALGVKVSPEMIKQMEKTEGVHLVEGLGMPPKPIIAVKETETTDSKPVVFIGKSTGNPDTWVWDFGDGTKCKGESAKHIFKEPGEYTVTLTATNASGKGTDCFKIKVKGGVPVADFKIANPEKPKYAGTAVAFINNSVGKIEISEWDFGDGTPINKKSSPEHIFTKAGNFKVTLKVKGPYGENKKSDFIKISQPQSVQFSFSPKEPVHNQKIKFANESIGEYRKWEWDFGDGNTSNEHSPEHAYKKVGDYNVTLTVTDVDSKEKKKTCKISIKSGYKAVNAKFILPVSKIGLGEILRLTDQSTGSIDKWKWEMGDGTVYKTRNPEHKYIKSGTFTITLTVSGPINSSTVKEKIIVEKAELVFSVKPVNPVEDEPAVFVNETVGEFKNWQWDFGDGSASQEKNAEHMYKKSGEYEITLSAVGPDNKIKKSKKTIKVKSGAEPELLFSLIPGSKTESRPPLLIKLKNNCKGEIKKYIWDFGDGTTSDDINPEHVYNKPGNYKISLKIIDHKGHEYQSTSSQGINIKILKPRLLPLNIQWIIAASFYFILWILFKIQPYHSRSFKYQIDDNPRKKHKSLTSDRQFLWQENDYLKKDSNDFTDGFKIIMKLNWLLKKKYYLKVLRGNVKATKKNGKPLNNNLLANGVIISVRGEHEIRILNLGTGMGWVMSHFVFLVIAATLLLLGIVFL